MPEQQPPNRGEGRGNGGTIPPVEHRWAKGQSGNPGGRPKGESITSLLRKVLEQEHNGKLLKEVLAERLVKEALSGKFPFAKELLDRVEGRVTEKQEVTVHKKPHWREILAQISDDDYIDLFMQAGMPHLLSARHKELAIRKGILPPDPNYSWIVPEGSGAARAEPAAPAPPKSNSKVAEPW